MQVNFETRGVKIMLLAGIIKRKIRHKKIKTIIKSTDGLRLPPLILNEIWLQNFHKRYKNNKMQKLESNLKESLKKQARITEAYNKLHDKKKQNLNVIMDLTPKVFATNVPESSEKSNESAKVRMETLQTEVLEINDNLEQLKIELAEVPNEIDNMNRQLLNETIEVCYHEMLTSQQNLEALAPKIDKRREELKKLVEQQAIYKETYQSTYTLLHHLVGETLIDRLDSTHMNDTNGEN